MGEPEWTPANPAERDLADALTQGNGPEFARILRSATLFLPLLPEPGSEAELYLAELLPPDAPYIPVFTSVESLVWTFGDLIEEYEAIDFTTLSQRWPDVHHQLAVNPGSPIATFLPPHTVADLAEGKQSLVAVEEIQQAMADEALDQIRQLSLTELAGADHQGAGTGQQGDPELREDPPANQLEAALREAVAQSDGERYMHALLAGDPVILLTASPVADPDEIFDDGFPWRIVGGDQAKVIAVFSSPEMLACTGTGAATSARIEVDFLHVLANWPDEEHLLYVNPGSVMELLLPGEMVLEVVSSMAEALDQSE